MKTMICLILDRSGSMAGLEADVIGGVNSFLEEQKKLPDPASICMVRFDSDAIERFREMDDLHKAAPIGPADFQPRGMTPLLDAVGQTITKLDEDWKREKADRCIVLIATDGHENHSREYTAAKVKAMITARMASNLWSFIYLGAHADAFAEAHTIGIPLSNTARHSNTPLGTQAAYASAGMSTASFRTGATGATAQGLGDLDETAAPWVMPTTSTSIPVPPTNSGTSTVEPWTPPPA